MNDLVLIHKRPHSPACKEIEAKTTKRARQTTPICLHCDAMDHTWIHCVDTQCARCNGIHPNRRCPNVSLIHYLPQGFQVGPRQSLHPKSHNVIEETRDTSTIGKNDALDVSIPNLCNELSERTTLGTAGTAVPFGGRTRPDSLEVHHQVIQNGLSPLSSSEHELKTKGNIVPNRLSESSLSRNEQVKQGNPRKNESSATNQDPLKTVVLSKSTQSEMSKLPDDRIRTLPPSTKDFAIERFPQLDSIFPSQPYYRLESVSKAKMDSFRARILNAMQKCGAQGDRPLPEEAKKLRWVAASEAAEMLRFWLGYVCEKQS